MLRILLADDHAVVRHGVKQILADAFAQATFGEAQNAHELLELVGKRALGYRGFGPEHARW